MGDDNDKIVNFYDPEDSNIMFSDMLYDDNYLQWTALNAMRLAGYSCDTHGVIKMQKNNGLKVTGSIDNATMYVLSTIFEPEQSQIIIDYMNDKEDIRDLFTEVFNNAMRSLNIIKAINIAFLICNIIILILFMIKGVISW